MDRGQYAETSFGWIILTSVGKVGLTGRLGSPFFFFGCEAGSTTVDSMRRGHGGG